MSEIEEVTTAQLARVVTIWPVLKGKPEVVDEMRRAILRHATKLDAEDIRSGVDDCIANSPTSGWPPGPHEVVGCILIRSTDRRRGAKAGMVREQMPHEQVVGRMCVKCAGPLSLIPDERVIYCEECNLVQVISGEHPGNHRWHMDHHEVTGTATRTVGSRGTDTPNAKGELAAIVARIKDNTERNKASAEKRQREKVQAAAQAAAAATDDDEIQWDEAS